MHCSRLLPIFAPAIRCHHDLIGNPVRIRNNTRCCISPACLATRARASAKTTARNGGISQKTCRIHTDVAPGNTEPGGQTSAKALRDYGAGNTFKTRRLQTVDVAVPQRRDCSEVTRGDADGKSGKSPSCFPAIVPHCPERT